MNRPRLVGVLSTVLGSTAGFLILSRWGLAGTVTGAILMPVIFTVVSFCSHESMERFNKWMSRRFKKGSASAPADKPATEETLEPRPAGRHARSLQWSVVALAFLAFAFSLYSLTQEDVAGVTILQERVVETVTVTTEQSSYSVARNSASASPTTTDASTNEADMATTTTMLTNDDDEPPVTTVSTEPGSPTSTTTIP